MKSFFIICALSLGLCFQTIRANEAGPSVELRWHGKPTELSEPAQRELCAQAVRLVESSNFHSGDANSFRSYLLPGAIPEIQREYRATVAGNYIVFSFPDSRKIRTVGGEITAFQIVIGLNREDFASDLFTINELDSVVSHGKYAGEYCIAFLNALKQYLHAD